MSIHFAVNTKHHYSAQTFQSLFHSYCQVSLNVLLLCIFYFCLSFKIIRVHRKETNPFLLSPRGSIRTLENFMTSEQRICQGWVVFLQQRQLRGGWQAICLRARLDCPSPEAISPRDEWDCWAPCSWRCGNLGVLGFVCLFSWTFVLY